MRLEWHIKMLNDFEVPWHEFFRRYWWGGTAAGIYELRCLQIKRCGRLGQKAVLALDCCPSERCRPQKKAASVANWQKNPELVTKWGCFRGREGGSLIQ